MNITYFLSILYLIYLIGYGFEFAVAFGDWAHIFIMGR